MGKLARQVQEVTGEHVELTFVDQGSTGENAATAAQQYGIRLEVVKHTQAKRGSVLLPRRFSFPRLCLHHARQPLPLDG